MPVFRLPYPIIDTSDTQKALMQIGSNLAELEKNYNRVLKDLDADVFYKVLPMVDGEIEASAAFTQSHRVKVVHEGKQYYIALDEV